MIDRAALEKSILPLAIVVAWEWAGRNGLLPTYLSRPSAILGAILELTWTGELARNALASLFRAYVGFTIGAGTGVIAGLAAGMTSAVRNFFDPLVSFIYPVPKIAFLSVFLLLFGLGHGSQIAIISVAVFFPVYISARYAVLSVNPLYVWSGQNMGADRATVFIRVLLPASMPELFAGLRIGLAHTFVILFAAELIGAREGLGFMMVEGEEALRFDIMFAGITAFAVIGFVHDRILLTIRKRVLRGQIIGTQEQGP